ncbi:DNA alkylation repair protein [Bacillus canaveralius]|nr:DNA alkylation repair protein [Bacillus canaveralius]
MEKNIGLIKEMLTFHRNEENAEPMEKYMRNQFPFLGIKTPERNQLAKEFFHKTNLLKEPFNEEFVLKLWIEPEREYQYVALDYIGKSLKKLDKEQMPFFEQLITTKSWWDTVDMLAPKPVGKIAAEHPGMIEEYLEGWANGENLWLRRSALLFQLKYKNKTNAQLLYRYISLNAESKEFFIQKAIGWALREYSKTNPDSVQQFIDNQPLAPLSVREGSKYLS